MNVIVVASRKGGSGKSTLTAHLAAHVAKPSRRTLVIDADPQGSLSLWHSLRGGERPALTKPGRPLSDTLKAAKKDGFEWVFIDTPPNKSPIVGEAIRAATLVVIPTRPSVFDLAAVTETIEACRAEGKPYAVVMNAAPPRRGESESFMVRDARAGLSGMKVPVWSGQITHRTDLSFAVGAGAGVKEFDPDSAAAAEIAALWSAIDKSVKVINSAQGGSGAMHKAAA